jgi:perosamine synthetase
VGSRDLATTSNFDCHQVRTVHRPVYPVSWRCQPPVLSPILVRGLAEGFGAAIGLTDGARNHVSLALQRRYGCGDALLTDSGTSALILALRRLVPQGGTVAYPAFGCIDLTTAAVGAQVHVRLYDVDPATLSPDLDSLRSAIRRGVDAIVVAHLFGYPADIIGVAEIAAGEGMPVIEDAAQGAGGSLHGALLGSLADIAILSFGRGKGVTGGSGGAVLVRTPELVDWTLRTRSELRAGSRGVMDVGKLAAQRVFSNPNLYRLPASIPGLRLGEMVYHSPRIPVGMSAASSAILRRSLEAQSRETSRRRQRAREWVSRLRDAPHISLIRPVHGGEGGFLRFALTDKSRALKPCTSLGALRGYPMTLDQHPQLASLLHRGERAGKGSEFLRDRLFTLPTHSRVDSQDITRLHDWLEIPELDSNALLPAT